MIAVAFPEPKFRIKQEGEKQYVFDAIRKQWLLLSNEEWVRQNFIAFLIETCCYPPSVIAIEKEIQLYDIKKRFDILVYNKDHEPWMMIECKSADIPLNETVLQQLLRYNISVPVEYMIITNGHSTIGWKKELGRLEIIEAMPVWQGK